MQKNIHPTYYKEATITCACGAVFKTGSTVEKLTTEICSQCHPFYTGKKKFVDAGGRVDRFKKLTERAEKAKATSQATKEKKAAKVEKEKATETKSSQGAAPAVGQGSASGRKTTKESA